MAGKGDSYRPVNGERYRAGYDRIFGPKKTKEDVIKATIDDEVYLADDCVRLADVDGTVVEARLEELQ